MAVARGRRTKEPRTGWRLRIALALAAAAACYLGVAHSLAQTLKRTDPAWAHALAPWDARLTAALAEKRLVDNQQPGDQPETIRLARHALQQSPMAVAAVTTLGWQAQAHGDIAGARRWFDYSQALSRRDLQTQIWAIEDAVTRGDVVRALRHYDLALRTNNQASDLLFPILASAIAERDVRDRLVATLLRHPPWGEHFVNYLTFDGADPRASLQLVRQLQGAGWTVPEGARSSLVNALINGGATEEAWGYYAQIRQNVDRRVSRDPAFGSRINPPSVLDWVVIEGDASGSIQQTHHGNVFDFATSPGVGGPLLQQMQLLPPGAYRIDGHSDRIQQSDRSLPYWVLTCRDGRELGRVAIPNSTQARGAFHGQFVVPPDCRVQMLTLIARPSDEMSGVVGQIDRVRLSPAGDARS